MKSQNVCEKIIQKLKKRNTRLINKCRRFIAYNGKLKREKENYKKRNQRLQQEKEQEITDLKEELLKMNPREEMLQHALKKTYHNWTKRLEQQI